jgi:hypothetical protein
MNNLKKKNKNLLIAKISKNDEFYTTMETIENELYEYKNYFKNKTIYCNCDNPTESNFVKFFINNFDTFELNKIIATSFNKNGNGLYGEFNKDKKLIIKNLIGNGSFDSEECLKFLNEADIIITNPPFSLFRKFINLLIDNKKDFIVLGNVLKVIYDKILKQIIENKIFIGHSTRKGIIKFLVPDDYEFPGKTFEIKDNKKYYGFGIIRWFTTLNHNKFSSLELKYDFDPNLHKRLDNYNILNVDKIEYIPKNYDGLICVPITFIDKYNSNQFKILGELHQMNLSEYLIGPGTKKTVNGRNLFSRLVIKLVE